MFGLLNFSAIFCPSSSDLSMNMDYNMVYRVVVDLEKSSREDFPNLNKGWIGWSGSFEF
jgi:hypothetical protein